MKNPFIEVEMNLKLYELKTIQNILTKIIPEGSKEELIVSGLYAKITRKIEEIEKE